MKVEDWSAREKLEAEGAVVYAPDTSGWSIRFSDESYWCEEGQLDNPNAWLKAYHWKPPAGIDFSINGLEHHLFEISAKIYPFVICTCDVCEPEV